jgi:hypothetical protein
MGMGWDVARWYSAYLACARPWVRSQHQKRKDKKKKERKKWEDLPWSWVGRLNAIKIFTIPRAIQIKCNLYRNTKGIPHRIKKEENLMICLHRTIKTSNSQSNFGQK